MWGINWIMDMEISSRIETRGDVQAICVHLKGDYQKLDYVDAWNKLGEYCHAHRIDYDCPDAEYINIYRDNPATTPPGECRADVCIASAVVRGLEPCADVDVITVFGGRYIVYGYQGPYEMLGAVNAKIYGELLPESGVKIKACEGVIEHCQMFERYLNDPEATPSENLITEIWIPIE